MNSPVVSFQLESEEAYTKLLQLVEEALESNTTHKAEKKEKKERSLDDEKDKQFKVITNTCTTSSLISVMQYSHVFVLIIMMLIKTNYTWIKIAMHESSWNFVVYTYTTHNWKFCKCILKHWTLFFLRNCMSWLRESFSDK